MIFKDFCLTIAFLILASLVIAITLVPLLCYFLLDETKAKQMSFAEAYDKIAENVQKAAAKKAYDEWIVRLKDTSFIKIYPMPKE